VSPRKRRAAIVPEQQAYYRALFRAHGDDPRAMGYNDAPTRDERFARLARLFDGEREPFTVHEVGCGLGHFGEFLALRYPMARYSGSDIVDEFVAECRRKFPRDSFHVRDVVAEMPEDRHDYVTMSGTLNGRLSAPEDEWRELVETMLGTMYAMCRRGMAANFLTSYGDPDRRRPELHYQDPAEILDFATRRLSRHVEIDASGPLYEFTLRVHRPESLRRRYPGAEFDRYFA